MKQVLVLAALTVAVVTPAACSAEENGDSSGGSGEEASEGTATEPETDSGNTENPPPEDIDSTECTSDVTGAIARGQLTNHSSELSGYMISVGFVDQAGTRVAEGTAVVNSVQPGQTATWEAHSFQDVPFASCEVVSVERLAQ